MPFGDSRIVGSVVVLSGGSAAESLPGCVKGLLELLELDCGPVREKTGQATSSGTIDAPLTAGQKGAQMRAAG